MRKVINYGRYYDDFDLDEIIDHPVGKTIFESDNNLFSLLTMNHHPVHLDINYASQNQHGKILVVGTLVFSLAVGLTVGEISGKAIANLLYEDILHKAPVFINDTIYACTRVLDKIPSKTKNDRGIIYVKTTVVNQNDQIVLEFKRKVLVKRNINSQ
jgi:acyl dehydratase